MTSVAEPAERGTDVTSPAAASPAVPAPAVPSTYRRSGLAWALLSGVCWGADGVVLGVALTMAPFIGAAALVAPLAAAALHDLLATGWMVAFNTATGRLRQLPRSLASRQGLTLCAAAVIGGPIAMSGYLFGIKYAGAAYALALTATYPAVGAVLSRVFLREHVTRLGWLGIAVTVTGAIIATYTPPAGEMPHFYLGIGLAALATFGWGVEGVLAIHAMKAVDPVVAGTLRMATSAFVYLVVVLPLVGGLRVLGTAFGSATLWLILGSRRRRSGVLPHVLRRQPPRGSQSCDADQLALRGVGDRLLRRAHRAAPHLAARRGGADHVRRRGDRGLRRAQD